MQMLNKYKVIIVNGNDSLVSRWNNTHLSALNIQLLYQNCKVIYLDENDTILLTTICDTKRAR